jgi:hypothetical protein
MSLECLLQVYHVQISYAELLGFPKAQLQSKSNTMRSIDSMARSVKKQVLRLFQLNRVTRTHNQL